MKKPWSEDAIDWALQVWRDLTRALKRVESLEATLASRDAEIKRLRATPPMRGVQWHLLTTMKR